MFPGMGTTRSPQTITDASALGAWVISARSGISGAPAAVAPEVGRLPLLAEVSVNYHARLKRGDLTGASDSVREATAPCSYR